MRVVSTYGHATVWQAREVDARDRYMRAQALGTQPNDASVQELIAMLSDDGSYELDDGCAFFERDPTVLYVSEAARESLVGIAQRAWPLIVDALPGATATNVAALIEAIDHLSPEQRAALPPSAHDAIVSAVERFAYECHRFSKTAAWERAFAQRVQSGELAEHEAFWRARMSEHPLSDARDHALLRLVRIATDKDALARELVGWLESDKYPWYPMSWDTVIGALHELQLPPDLVQRLATSSLPRKHQSLVIVLARYPEAATALVPVCVDMLQHKKIGDYTPWMPESPLDERRWRIAADALVAFGPHAASVRPVLVERLLATNEQMSLMGSLRSRLLDVLGDPVALLAEIEARLDALATSSSIVDKNRAQQIRDLIAVRMKR